MLPLLLLACATTRLAPRAELHLTQAAFEAAAPGEMDQALAAVTSLGPAALPLLPDLLERAQAGELDRRRLADALEAMGPRAVPLVEAGLPGSTGWGLAGLDALGRLGPEGIDALLRLARDPKLGLDVLRALDEAALRTSQAVGTGRQLNPRTLPPEWYTPMDLERQAGSVGQAACAVLLEEQSRAAGYAASILNRVHESRICVGRLLALGGDRRVAAALGLQHDDPYAMIGHYEALLAVIPSIQDPLLHAEAMEVALYAVPRTPGAFALVSEALVHGPRFERIRLLNLLFRERALLYAPLLRVQLPEDVQAAKADSRDRSPYELEVRDPPQALVEVMKAAIRAGQAPPRRTTLALLRVAREDDRSWEAVIRSLQALGDDGVLYEILGDVGLSRQERVIAALGLRGPLAPEAEAVLQAALRDTGPQLRGLALYRLLLAPDGTALPSRAETRAAALRMAREDPSSGLREAATRMLALSYEAGWFCASDLALLDALSREADPAARDLSLRLRVAALLAPRSRCSELP